MAHVSPRPPLLLALAASLFVNQGVVRPLAAQQATGRQHVVQGVVFDSVAGKPLGGATVQLAARDGIGAPLTAATDSAGRYRIGGVPSGTYVLGFYHEALTALGLDAPTRGVALATDVQVTVDLAVPSSATIRALRCGAPMPYAPGMLVGSVRDVATLGGIAGTQAIVHWRAFALDSANYRVVEERRTASIEPDGMLLVCQLPVDVPLDVLITAPGHREVAGTVVHIPAQGIGRLDVLLADSGLASGGAMIRGRVTRESGKAVTSGRVFIKALNREVAVQNGEFVAARVPAGSWVAEARVIGVEPQDVLVTASDSAVATAAITVSNGAQRLDAVTVVGKRDRDLDVLDQVLRRSRIGMGTTFLPGHPALRSAVWTSDVMREARGFQYHGPNEIDARGVTGGLARCKAIAVYVNDVRQPDGFDGLDLVAPAREVLAVETWPDYSFVPVQYHYSGPVYNKKGDPMRPCALVLIWTRRHF